MYTSTPLVAFTHSLSTLTLLSQVDIEQKHTKLLYHFKLKSVASATLFALFLDTGVYFFLSLLTDDALKLIERSFFVKG